MERLGGALRGELNRLGPQAGMPELVERWPEAVGPAIARHAWPARIGRDGTLLANASDAIWAFELGQQAAAIAERLGVPKVRFAPGPLPEPEPEVRVQTPPTPTPLEQAQAAAVVAGISDENLRKAVQNTIELALARGRTDLPA